MEFIQKRGVMNSHEEPPYIKQRWTLPNSEHILEKNFSFAYV